MARAEWISDAARFDAIAGEWDALAAASDGTPFTLHAWLSAWWEAFGAGRELRICAIWRDDRLVAGLPLCASGRSLEMLANIHTPVLRPLALDPPALALLTETVLDTRAPRLWLHPLPADDQTKGLVAALRSRRRLTATESLYASPIVDTTGEFSDWRTLTKPRWRTAIERLRRKAEREHELEMRLVEAPADREAELDAGLKLEAAGWKGESETAVLSSPDTERFYRTVAERFDARGELRLSAMSLDGRLVAFDLCLSTPQRLYLLKTAYDESLSKLAPGLVMRLGVIERCFELRLEAFEFLGPTYEWKLKFSTSERAHVAVHSHRATPIGMSRHVYRQVGRPALRRAYQAVRRPGRSE
jgi:CelD/BcsL family acetyltransferase involved in cellulose biosynthesis